MPSNLVTRTQLIDSQDLSSAESLSKEVNCTHLSTEDTVGICRLRRSQETLVKRLQQEGCRQKIMMEVGFEDQKKQMKHRNRQLRVKGRNELRQKERKNKP